MKNMKVLDLETGKYLELGEAWEYCGEYIRKIACEQILYKTPHTDPLINSICEKTGAVVYGGRYVLMNEIFYIEGIEHKYGDVFRFYINKRGDYMVDYRAINCQALNCKFDKDGKIIKLGNTNIVKIEYIGSPFEEYSKQFRNEPNKFDELKAFLK